jgi:hypothetical protein
MMTSDRGRDWMLNAYIASYIVPGVLLVVWTFR